MSSPQYLVTPDDPPATPGDPPPAPQVEIVVPVRNEERGLARSVGRLAGYLATSFPFRTQVTIADNGSTDRTWAIATGLAQALPGVRAVRLAQPGRGRALRSQWAASGAGVLAYMDVDLSTDLNALLPLVAAVLSGHSDLAIGTRLAHGARVIRGPRREVISRCYNLLLHATLGARFSDAQCGFKAISADKAAILLPLTRDTGWFFDTELLVLAERAGLRIHEVPVDWIDDTDSRVSVVRTALADLKGIARVGWGLARGTIRVPTLRGASPAPAAALPAPAALAPAAPAPAATARAAPAATAPAGGGHRRLPRQAGAFLAIGALSTAVYLLLYLALRSRLPAQPASAASLLLTAIGNTAANRRFTFGIAGRAGLARHQAQGLLAFGAGLLVTSGALAGLHRLAPHPRRAAEVTVLLLASLAATVARFLLYRSWVFRERPHSPDRASRPSPGPASRPRPARAAPASRPAPARPSRPGGPPAAPPPGGLTPLHPPRGTAAQPEGTGR